MTLSRMETYLATYRAEPGQETLKVKMLVR